MPELPEVETMVRGIRPHIVGRTIKAVRRCRCNCKPIAIRPGFAGLAKHLAGLRVDEVSRLGKRVVLHLADRSCVVIEPRMTGLMLLSDPPDREHLRLEWQFSGKSAYDSLWFWDRRGLGTVSLYPHGSVDLKSRREALGPDALAMTVENWRACCQATPRAIKILLLDQCRVAGIGNLYASEILHVSSIHPGRPSNRLRPPELDRLCRAVRSVLEEAIRDEGSTLGDATYRNALNQSGNYQHKHRVYGRVDQHCLTCGDGVIRRIVQAQRSTFFCPRCQQ